MRIVAFAGKVSELRKALARHRDFLEKESPDRCSGRSRKQNKYFSPVV